MMPCPVVVGKRAYDLGKHVRPDGLVERRTESPVGRRWRWIRRQPRSTLYTGTTDFRSNVSAEIGCDVADVDARRRPDRCDGIRRILCDKRPVDIEPHQAVPEDGRGMMPFSVIV